jgi:hypothetical protein
LAQRKAPRRIEENVSDHGGGARTAVRLTDIASRVPGVLADMPAIVRGALTGLLAQPGSKKSIGMVFQERAARYGDRVFLRFGDQQLTYRDANAAANRYAAVLAARGVGSGDVVAIMLRNSPHAVLAMLAAVKCGAVAGMINYHQRGEVLAHSLGLLDAKVLIAETDLVSAVAECGGSGATETLTIEDLERFAVSAPATNPASASAVQARDTAFYIFTSGTTGFPKASVMTHLRWLKALAAFGGIGLRLKSSDTLYSCLPLYHNNALTVALSSVTGCARRSGTSSRIDSGSGASASSTPPARATPLSSTSSMCPGPPVSFRCRWPTWNTTPTAARHCVTRVGGCAGCPPASPACCSARSTGCSRSTATPTKSRAKRSWSATLFVRATAGSIRAT